MPEVIGGDDGFQFEFQRFKDRRDVVFSVEASAGLNSGWSELWNSADTPFGGGTAASELVQVALAGDEQEFARLRVSLVGE